jgi:hypothetical protein
MYRRYFQWLKEHPIDKINKYTERYELQTRWIAQQRENPKLKEKVVGKEIEVNKEEVRAEQKQ